VAELTESASIAVCVKDPFPEDPLVQSCANDRGDVGAPASGLSYLKSLLGTIVGSGLCRSNIVDRDGER